MGMSATIDNYLEELEVVYDKEPEAAAFKHACMVWELCTVPRMLMKKDLGPNVNKAWKKHADKVKAAAKTFVQALIQVAGVSKCRVSGVPSPHANPHH